MLLTVSFDGGSLQDTAGESVDESERVKATVFFGSVLKAYLQSGVG